MFLARSPMRSRSEATRNAETISRRSTLLPIIFPGSPERWWGDEALQAEAQAAQAPGEERHQAACNILAMRPRSLFRPGFGSRRHPTFRLTPPNEGPAPALERAGPAGRCARSGYLPG